MLLAYCFFTLIPFVSVKVTPPQVTVSDINGAVQLNWNEVSNAQNYQIFRSTAEEDGFVQIADTHLTSITDPGAKPDTEYFYYVVSEDDEGRISENSNTVSVVCSITTPVMTLSNDETGRVKISWDAVEGAKQYHIYRSETADGKYELLTSTADVSAVDTLAEVGQRYCYKVMASGTNPQADSGFSQPASRVCILATPAVTISNVPSTGKIKLSWDAVEGAKEYRVYRSTTQGNGYSLLIATDKTSVTNTKADVGSTFSYKVVAVAEDATISSVFSAPLEATCTLPNTTVTLSNIEESGKVKISWKKVKGAVGYEVYRAESEDGEYTLVSTEKGTSAVDEDGVACTTYFYKVKALDKNPLADSMFSDTKSAPCRLAKSTVTVSVDNSGKAVVQWTKSEGAVEYQIYRSTTGNTGSFKLFSTVTGTKLTNPKAENGKTYYYKVRPVAQQKAYNGVFSDSDCVYIDADGAYLPSYVMLPSVTLYPDMNDLNQTVTAIYMEPVYQGRFYSEAGGGKWIMAKYKGKTYYTFVNDTMPSFTRTQSSFDYTSKDNSKLQNQIVSLASKYAFEPTFYAHQMSDGVLDEATGKYGFDCSGLVAYVFNTVVQQENPLYKLSRSLNSQVGYDILYNKGYNNQFSVIDVKREDMQPGDIIFFKVNHNDSREIDHCGIYLGNNEFVHATSRFGGGVSIMPLDYVFNTEFRYVRRFTPKEIKPANQSMKNLDAFVHIYKEKSSASDILYTFKKGEKATLLYTSATGNWGYMKAQDGTTGFVLMKHFELIK